MSIWNEIRNNYYEEDDKVTYIDAWMTDDDNEEGDVIAKVYDNGAVEYLDERAKTDEYAQEIINETLAEAANR